MTVLPPPSPLAAMPPGPPQSWGEELVQVFERQRALVRELDTLSQQQGGLIGGEDAGPLLELLSKRQHLVDELDRLNARIEPYRRNWRTVLDALPERYRLLVSTRADELEALAAAVMHRDRADIDAMEQRTREIAGELKRMTTARHAGGGYARTGLQPVAPRFQDRKG